jgi:hypothetical protein
MIFETGPFENRNDTKKAVVSTRRILDCFVAITPRNDSLGGVAAGYRPAPVWI